MKNVLANLGALKPQNVVLKAPAEKLSQTGKPLLPVLVFSCNRPDVRRNLDGLLKYRPDPEQFPIIVSQDCAHSTTAEIIRSYGSQVTHIQVICVCSAASTNELLIFPIWAFSIQIKANPMCHLVN